MLEQKEAERLYKLTEYERALRQEGFQIIAGVDEAGRGPLAGPVVAACCSLPEDLYINGVNDSKQLDAETRKKLFQTITKDPTIQWAYSIIEADIIDKVNIFKATVFAMGKALMQLKDMPDIALVDGLDLDALPFPTKKLIKGDQKSQSIAAASIIAKETRDEIMLKMNEKWPEYGFGKNKGYGTKEHLLAIEKYGLSPIHRQTFCKHNDKQLTLF